MTNSVKQFIEENKDLLEDNNLYHFLMLADNELLVEDVEELINILETANIETTPTREMILRYIIDHVALDVYVPIPLANFIGRFLEGRLGYDFMDIRQFMLENNDFDLELFENPEDDMMWWVRHDN